MREEATALTWIETESEIEALIKEAELIKRHLPKFNILMRDDKSYFYAVITNAEFPRIFVAHKTQIGNEELRKSDSPRGVRLPSARSIGPFTSGSALRAALKLLRRVFPYCTCKQAHKRPCLNSQIGRCPGFCCVAPLPATALSAGYSLIRTNKRIAKTAGKNDIKRYRDNIRKILAVLSGKRQRIASETRRLMRDAAKKQNFERAAILRDQMESMENIFAHRRMLEGGLPLRSPPSRAQAWTSVEHTIRSLLGTNRRIRRTEGYDISNISGTAATGSMVVFINGSPAKSEYRKFKIKTVRGANDAAAHREVMRRRLAHPEWGMPDLVVMDGGKPQLNAALSVIQHFRSPTSEVSEVGLRNINHKIPVVVALAKREEELYTEGKQKPVRLDSLPPAAMHFFQRVRDESHRFAKKYHHKLREISYRQNIRY